LWLTYSQLFLVQYIDTHMNTPATTHINTQVGTSYHSLFDMILHKYHIEFAEDLIRDFLIGTDDHLKKIYMRAVRDMVSFVQFPLEWHITKHLDNHVNNNLLQYKATINKVDRHAIFKLIWTHSLGSEDIVVIVENRLEYISFDENLQVFFMIEDDFRVIEFFLKMIDTRAFYIEL
jgi:hypothetical protein